MLDRFASAVSPTFFRQNIFLILISHPSSRLSALNYIVKRVLKPPDVDEVRVDAGLLIRGLAAVLQDDNMLVRRNGLDSLLRLLQIDSSTFTYVFMTPKEVTLTHQRCRGERSSPASSGDLNGRPSARCLAHATRICVAAGTGRDRVPTAATLSPMRPEPCGTCHIDRCADRCDPLKRLEDLPCAPRQEGDSPGALAKGHS